MIVAGGPWAQRPVFPKLLVKQTDTDTECLPRGIAVGQQVGW